MRTLSATSINSPVAQRRAMKLSIGFPEVDGAGPAREDAGPTGGTGGTRLLSYWMSQVSGWAA